MSIILLAKIVGVELAFTYIWWLILFWDARQEYRPPKPKINKGYKEYKLQ